MKIGDVGYIEVSTLFKNAKNKLQVRDALIKEHNGKKYVNIYFAYYEDEEFKNKCYVSTRKNNMRRDDFILVEVCNIRQDLNIDEVSDFYHIKKF